MKHVKHPSIDENEEMFKEIETDIFLFGHTHTVSVNNKENRRYINSGSLSCPMESNVAQALKIFYGDR